MIQELLGARREPQQISVQQKKLSGPELLSMAGYLSEQSEQRIRSSGKASHWPRDLVQQ